jgi:tetratricopeptide (TPR) repeat protein
MTEEIRPKSKLEHIVEVHGKKIFAAGIAFIVLIGGWAWYSYKIKPQKQEDATSALFMVQRYFANDSIGPVLNGSEDYLGALDIADQYGSMKAGKLAHYYAGRTYMKEAKFEEAIDHLEKTSFSDELMAPLTKCLIGDCYSELGDYEKAADLYWDAAKMRDNDYTTPRCYQKAAVVYEKLGDWENALKAYEAIKADYLETEVAKDIQKYISRAETRLQG